MKIVIKENATETILKTLKNVLNEIKAADVGLDAKKDTTLSDDDLLGLISKNDLADKKDYLLMLKNFSNYSD